MLLLSLLVLVLLLLLLLPSLLRRPPRHADYPTGEQFYLRHTSVEKFSVAVPK